MFASSQVRSLIEDIRDVRFHKVETNLEKFTASTVTVCLLSLFTISKMPITSRFSAYPLKVVYSCKICYCWRGFCNKPATIIDEYYNRRETRKNIRFKQYAHIHKNPQEQ